MRQILFATFLMMLVGASSFAEESDSSRVVDTTFVFNAADFSVEHDIHSGKDYVNISDATNYAAISEERGTPFLFWLTADVFLRQDEVLDGFEYDIRDESLLMEDAHIALVREGTATLSEDYPSVPVVSRGVQAVDLGMPEKAYSWRRVSFCLCPFRYDAAEGNLYLAGKINLRVRIHKHSFAYRPFVEDGKVWLVGRERRLLDGTSSDGVYDGLTLFYFDGDTLVGNDVCRRWMRRTLAFGGNEERTELLAPLVERDSMVFFFYPGETEPRLLYDFRQRDSVLQMTLFDITDAEHSPMSVSRYGGSKEYSTPRFVAPGIFYISMGWLEGVGSLESPERSNPGHADRDYRMIRCSVGDEVLFQNFDVAEYADYVTGIDLPVVSANLPEKRQSVKGAFFDLTGRRLTAPPVRGLYIEDGRVRGR